MAKKRGVELMKKNEPRFKSLQASLLGTFAITYDGRLYACGSNNWGHLGVGDRESHKKLTPVKGLSNHKVDRVWIFVDAVFASTADGGLYKTNSAGGEDECQFRSVSELGKSKIVGIYKFSSPQGIYLILNELGTLYGKGNHRQEFKAVANNIKWVEQFSDENAVIICDTIGKLFSFGVDVRGRLGIGKEGFLQERDLYRGGLNFSFKQILFGDEKEGISFCNEKDSIDRLTLSEEATYALTPNGTLFAWGNIQNLQGVWGMENTEDRYSPISVESPAKKIKFSLIRRAEYQTVPKEKFLPNAVTFVKVFEHIEGAFAVKVDGSLNIIRENVLKKELTLEETKGIEGRVKNIYATKTSVFVLTEQGWVYSCRIKERKSSEFTRVSGLGGKFITKLVFDKHNCFALSEDGILFYLGRYMAELCNREKNHAHFKRFEKVNIEAGVRDIIIINSELFYAITQEGQLYVCAVGDDNFTLVEGIDGVIEIVNYANVFFAIDNQGKIYHWGQGYVEVDEGQDLEFIKKPRLIEVETPRLSASSLRFDFSQIDEDGEGSLTSLPGHPRGSCGK